MQPLPTPDLISDLIETEAYRYQLAYEGFMVSSHKKRLKDHKKRIVWTALVIILMLLFSAFCIFLGIRLLGSEDQGWQKMIATLIAGGMLFCFSIVLAQQYELLRSVIDGLQISKKIVASKLKNGRTSKEQALVDSPLGQLVSKISGFTKRYLSAIQDENNRRILEYHPEEDLERAHHNHQTLSRTELELGLLVQEVETLITLEDKLKSDGADKVAFDKVEKRAKKGLDKLDYLERYFETNAFTIDDPRVLVN